MFLGVVIINEEINMKYTKILIILTIAISTKIWATNCENYILENFPGASKCKSISGQDAQTECVLNAVQKKSEECFKITAAANRNRCMVKELKALTGSVPKECLDKYKDQVNNRISVREKELYGSSSIEHNAKLIDKAEAAKANTKNKSVP